jgi:hypothetical protein
VGSTVVPKDQSSVHRMILGVVILQIHQMPMKLVG